MKEHYVSYEQAVKLQELGFDGKCLHFYPEASCLGIKKNCSHANFNSFEMRFNDKYGVIYSAPRLDQAAAWLREKGIDIEPRVYIVGKNREYRPYVMPPKKSDYIEYPPYLTSYAALSAGITEALKLIEERK